MESAPQETFLISSNIVHLREFKLEVIEILLSILFLFNLLSTMYLKVYGVDIIVPFIFHSFEERVYKKIKNIPLFLTSNIFPILETIYISTGHINNYTFHTHPQKLQIRLHSIDMEMRKITILMSSNSNCSCNAEKNSNHETRVEIPHKFWCKNYYNSEGGTFMLLISE